MHRPRGYYLAQFIADPARRRRIGEPAWSLWALALCPFAGWNPALRRVTDAN